MVLRIKYYDPTALISTANKFGANAKTEAEFLLGLSKTLNLNVIGVSFHVGSGCKNYTVYQNAIALARKVFDIGLSMGIPMNFLDIGGGFSGHKGDEIFEVKYFFCLLLYTVKILGITITFQKLSLNYKTVFLSEKFLLQKFC